MKPKSIYCPNCGVLSGIGWENDEERRRFIACVRDLTETLHDIMPQMGGIVLQDYGRLNRGLEAATSILQ